ncbi:hypothetical protein G7Z17_g6756 [Cylindrodendrum hubeiense]|uniref:Uncharacterized protein n=1 Tax=Cylindrodendrum hubeiense TaxID=595255 RepID=A0A9P5HAC1_9HYPO|nr:hypothetical protein G7Z17_g6756 [Cylindrodendrum hubeiense]
MSFHFVDSGEANTPGARRAIRRHVMKGRNVGKKIQGRGRKNAPPRTDGFFGDVHQPREEDREVIEAVKDALARQDGTKLLFPEIAAMDNFAATYLTLFHKPGNETLEATRHFSQAVHLINRTLSQASNPTDSTLAVVVSLAIHGNLTRNSYLSRIHFQGLQHILSTRPGGLASLRDIDRSPIH